MFFSKYVAPLVVGLVVPIWRLVQVAVKRHFGDNFLLVLHFWTFEFVWGLEIAPFSPPLALEINWYAHLCWWPYFSPSSLLFDVWDYLRNLLTSYFACWFFAFSCDLSYWGVLSTYSQTWKKMLIGCSFWIHLFFATSVRFTDKRYYSNFCQIAIFLM